MEHPCPFHTRTRSLLAQALKLGDKTFFVRTDLYGGVWVGERDQLYPELQQAIHRVVGAIEAKPNPRGLITVRLQGVWTEQYIASNTQSRTGNPFYERPATAVSFFLSFSSNNAMLARQIFADLRYDAKVEVWFDLDQAGEAPEHRRRIEAWLKAAVYRHRGFILLWTKGAKESSWVQKEITWALERASRERDFHFIVLKLDEKHVYDEISDTPYLIDCCDLWPVHGVNEGLFAAVTRRPGRLAWIEQHRQRGAVLMGEKESFGYEPFHTDSGVAISLQHWMKNGELSWRLDYEKDRKLSRVYGRGDEHAVDLGIRPGDYVASFVCRRVPLCRFWPGTNLWMRSDDLRIKPENVLVSYWERSSKDTSNLSVNKALTRARRRNL